MNYLAHIYLSGSDHEIIAGNFMGDAVKGKKYDLYKGGIRSGLLLHRFIDSFTDQHPVTDRMRERLHPYFHKYAGVVCDVFYDHFLANHWATYHDAPLQQFIDESYQIIQNFKEHYPEETLHMLPYMIKHDWMGNMLHVEGVARSLLGLSKRTSFPSGMDKAGPVLLKHYDDLEQDFHDFFPELKEACEKQIILLTEA